MFPSKCAYLFMILSWVISVQADCQYWDGTAPFCDGSCPSGCRTVGRSNCGNGACCWTGSKALCQCCGGAGPCTPTQTTTDCYGVVLVCKNQQVTLTFQGPSITTCSTYVCGICFGFSFLRRDVNDNTNSSCTNNLNVRHINPMLSDVTVQGNVTLSEKEIEEKLVSQFGPRLTQEEMKHVRIVKVLDPDLTIRGDDCK